MRRKDTHKSTDNVLTDLGFDDAEELSAKAILAVKLNELIQSRGAQSDRGRRDHRHDTAQGIAGCPLQTPEYFA